MASVVSRNLLSHLITLPVALKYFPYEVGNSSIGYQTLIASELLLGLLTQASSLKEFIIDPRQADDLDDPEALFSSLAGLDILDRLTLPVSMLLEPAQLGLQVGCVPNLLDHTPPPSLLALEVNLDHRCSGGLTHFLNVTGIPKNPTIYCPVHSNSKEDRDWLCQPSRNRSNL